MFDNFTCSAPDCCKFTELSYEIVPENSADTFLPVTCCETDKSSGKITYDVDVKQAGTAEFKIKGTSDRGDIGISEKITLTVLPKEKFIMNHAPNFAEEPDCPEMVLDFEDPSSIRGYYRC